MSRPTWVRFSVYKHGHGFTTANDFRKFTSTLNPSKAFGVVYGHEDGKPAKDRPRFKFNIDEGCLSLLVIDPLGIGYDREVMMALEVMVRAAERMDKDLIISEGAHLIEQVKTRYLIERLAFTTSAMSKKSTPLNDAVTSMIASSITSNFQKINQDSACPKIDVYMNACNQWVSLEGRIILSDVYFELPFEVDGPWFVGAFTSKGFGLVKKGVITYV